MAQRISVYFRTIGEVLLVINKALFLTSIVSAPLFVGLASATTYLEGVRLDGGYVNEQKLRDYRAVYTYPDNVPEGACGSTDFGECYHLENTYDNRAVTGSNGSCYTIRLCGGQVTNFSEYWGYSRAGMGMPCLQCSATFPGHVLEKCSDFSTCDSLYLRVGSFTSPIFPFDPTYLPTIEEFYGFCSMQPPDPTRPSGYQKRQGESSYTFTTTCDANKMVDHLYIEAFASITSETPPSGTELLLNGVAPSSIQQSSLQSNTWSGLLKWDLPVTDKCGSTVTLIPTVATGIAYASLNTIQVVLKNECEPMVSLTSSEVWPQKTGGSGVTSTISIALTKPAPSEGCLVDLTVEAVEFSGGHNHGGGRPKGTVSPVSLSFPGNQLTSAQAIYNSSEVAGDEQIIIKVKGNITNKVPITVSVPGLLTLTEGTKWKLVGATGAHPSNHWGTANTLYSLSDLASAYYDSGKGTLKINDISLEKGGLFDIGPSNGTFWNTPHKTHRAGNNIDISIFTVEGKLVTKDSINATIRDLGLNIDVKPEGNHHHLTAR